MIGSHGAKQLVAGFLRAHLPTYADAAGAPRPRDYLGREPTRLDRWPLVAVTTVSSGRLARVDYPEVDALDVVRYRFAYDLRVFAWVRERGADAADENRNRLTLAVREALLDRQELGAGAAATAAVDESTVAESYSDVEAVQLKAGNRYVAGAFVAFTLVAEEDLQRRAADTYGAVAATEVTARLIAPDEDTAVGAGILRTGEDLRRTTLLPHPALE